jgi:hypothetical protein
MPADEVIVDLTQYKDRVGQHIKPGVYTVVVEDAEPDTSKNDNPMVNLWLRVQGGEFDGVTIIDRLTQSPGALFRTVNFMQAVGLPTPKKRFKLKMSMIIGKTLDIEVDNGDPYKGRVKSEVRAYGRKGTLVAAGGAAVVAGEDAAVPDDDDALGVFVGDADSDDSAEEASDDSKEAVTVPADAAPEEVDLEELDLG